MRIYPRAKYFHVCRFDSNDLADVYFDYLSYWMIHERQDFWSYYESLIMHANDHAFDLMKP